MCFVVDENNAEVLIADKDIVCYKYTSDKLVDKKEFFSFIKLFHYEFNKLYKRNILRYDKYHGIKLYVGFHSYINKQRIPLNFIKTIKCIIPKGSRYLKNLETGEYISNMIIPIKVVANKY